MVLLGARTEQCPRGRPCGVSLGVTLTRQHTWGKFIGPTHRELSVAPPRAASPSVLEHPSLPFLGGRAPAAGGPGPEAAFWMLEPRRHLPVLSCTGSILAPKASVDAGLQVSHGVSGVLAGPAREFSFPGQSVPAQGLVTSVC